MKIEKKKNLLKMAVFALGSLLVLGLNFFFENSVLGEEVESSIVFEDFDYSSENFLDGGSVLRFDQNASNDLGLINKEDESFVFNVNAGRFWFNNEFGRDKVNFLLDRMVLIPKSAQFELQFVGGRLDLVVYGGEVYVGFLQEGVDLALYAGEYEEVFENKILVPEGNQISYSVSKIDERLLRLLYSKLVKELKYSSIPQSRFSNEWVGQNFARDAKRLEAVKQRFSSEILAAGVSSDAGLFSGVFDLLQSNLTFVPQKSDSADLGRVFSALDNALFYANDGARDEAEDAYLGFSSQRSSLSQEVFDEAFWEYLSELAVFDSGDQSYFLIKEMYADVGVQGAVDLMDYVRADLYSVLDDGALQSRAALKLYSEFLDKTIGLEEGLDYRQYIAFQNQFMDNLFMRFDYFYADENFAVKNFLEQELLRLYDEGQIKSELRQAFVSQKINFLKRLRALFFADEVSIVEAKAILSRLVEEVDDLMTPNSSELAVVEIFETQLSDISDFWGYLNSPEYHSSQLYGQNQEERYQSYLEEKDTIWSFINIQEDILGQDVPDLTVEEVAIQVEEVLLEVDQMRNVEVGQIEEAGQRYVEVSAVLGGYPFTGRFDRGKGTIDEVYVYDEIVVDRGVRLEDLLDIIKDQFADIVEEEDEDGEFSVETFAQRQARIYIVQQLEERGFVIELEDVVLTDVDDAIYRVNEVFIEGEQAVKATFDFVVSGEKAINLLLSVKGEAVVMDGEFSLDEVLSIVIAEADFL